MELLTSQQTVPNQFPTVSSLPYRIALIGEAPGADEVVAGQPFVGVSGRFLSYLLSRVGILRSACFIGNICQHRPPANDLSQWRWADDRIVEGLALLKQDLTNFDPNLIVCLGGFALAAAKKITPNVYLPDKLKNPQASITKCRGSLFVGFDNYKCLGAFHPANALRVYEQTPLILFDLKRARKESESKELRLPKRDIKVLRTVEEVDYEITRLQTNKKKLGTDIEGYVNNLTVISFADDPLCGYVIPFVGPNGNFWSPDDELRVWLRIKDLLEDCSVSKVLQSGLYDRFVLAYTYGILVRRVTDDTMLKHWEVYCELPKALALQTSIYTNEPFYKDERTTEDWEEFWQYSGKDSCVTLEISNKLDSMVELTGAALDHYKFNVSMQDPLLYMELRGLNYDQEQAQKVAKEIKTEINLLQHKLNELVGCNTNITCENDAVTLMQEVFCVKRHGTIRKPSDCLNYARKPFVDNGAINRAIQLCTQGYPFNDSRNGEFSRLLECHFNTDSPPQLAKFLYETLALPVQLHKKTRKPTTDAIALLKLYKKTSNPVLKLILKLSSLLTQLQTLEILSDPDGRVRCSYNVVGTETGRLSCSKSPTRSGYNLQTVTKKQRRLFQPDPGHQLFQCDLSGADGWTVAAHSKRLGDPTMFDDYVFGLKPANIIARMYDGVNVNGMDRQTLKEESKKVDAEGWVYFTCKRVQHASSYGMGKLTMSNQILEDSWKKRGEPIYVEPASCEDLQNLFFQRYPGVVVWQRWVKEQLKQKRQLVSANGHTRRFFGRPDDHDTHKQAFADEPQNVTTYVTNMAMLRLWNDPKNRHADGSLKIDLLHQMHDALIGQFLNELTDWARSKIRESFNNQLTIANQLITIPFEGHYGSSWGPEDLINTI